MSANWLGVACAAHVRRGRAAGFMQLGHGRATPLRRVSPGDRVVYYSPTLALRGRDRLRAFTAIGIVREGEPYLVEMDGGFLPFRRDVDWLEAREAPIAPLLDVLDLTADRRNWGYQLRFGVLAISDRDLRQIAEAMGARLPVADLPVRPAGRLLRRGDGLAELRQGLVGGDVFRPAEKGAQRGERIERRREGEGELDTFREGAGHQVREEIFAGDGRGGR